MFKHIYTNTTHLCYSFWTRTQIYINNTPLDCRQDNRQYFIHGICKSHEEGKPGRPRVLLYIPVQY